MNTIRIKLQAGRRRMRCLVRCLTVLGPRLGYRYWKLQNLAEADPKAVPGWVRVWRLEADCEDAEGNHMAAGMLRRFAQEAEDQNARFHSSTNETSPSVGATEKDNDT